MHRTMTLSIAGEDYEIKKSFAVGVAIEKAAGGEAIPAVAQKLMMGHVSLSNACAIIQAMLDASGHKVAKDVVQEHCAAFYADVLGFIGDFLAAFFESAKKKEPAAEV